MATVNYADVGYIACFLLSKTTSRSMNNFLPYIENKVTDRRLDEELVNAWLDSRKVADITGSVDGIRLKNNFSDLVDNMMDCEKPEEEDKKSCSVLALIPSISQNDLLRRGSRYSGVPDRLPPVIQPGLRLRQKCL